MSFCGSTKMSKWQNVNEAFRRILDRCPDEDENIKPGEVFEEKAVK